MRPRSKIPLPLLLAITGLAVLLCGCWWQRLLAFKNQLADFDRYVKVEETNGLILTTSSWIYTYVLKTSLERSSRRKTAQATFVFDTATHQLRQIEARFASLRFHYSFDKPQP